MFGRSGYRALPLGDFDRFQQSSFGFLGSQKGCLSPEPAGVGPGADAPESWPSCLCHGLISFLGFLLLLLTFPISGWFALKIVPTYERMIVFRLGRIRTPQGPGMVLLLPFIDSFQRVDLRTRAFNVPPCKVRGFSAALHRVNVVMHGEFGVYLGFEPHLTPLSRRYHLVFEELDARQLASKDGAVLSVGADVQFRIWDPVLSVMAVKDLNTATRMTAHNAMTKALLRRPLQEIQMERLKIGDQLLLEINDVTRAWGLEVDRVELAVEAVLQPPQDSPAVPNLDSTLQQLAFHLLGGSMSSVVGGAPPPGPGDTLEMISEVEPPASHAGAGDEPSSKQPVAEGLLTALQPFLSEALVSQVGACYQFNVILPSGTQSIYFLDLTAGQGRVGHGAPDGIPDVVVEMAEADLQALLCRELRPLGAYMSGRLKVKGDLAVVMKLEAVLRALK
ncbi:hypothetical protein ACRRTK_003612 [Alexandromys fortis]